MGILLAGRLLGFPARDVGIELTTGALALRARKGFRCYFIVRIGGSGTIYKLDIIFDEDRCRTRKDVSPLNLAIVRHIVLYMLKRDTSKLSRKRKKPEGFRQPRLQGSAAWLLTI
jgi:hypothetical protein